jgi:hypothetical protein
MFGRSRPASNAASPGCWGTECIRYLGFVASNALLGSTPAPAPDVPFIGAGITAINVLRRA